MKRVKHIVLLLCVFWTWRVPVVDLCGAELNERSSRTTNAARIGDEESIRWIEAILRQVELGGRPLLRFEGGEGEIPPQVVTWLTSHREVVLAKKSPFAGTFSWGGAIAGERHLYLFLLEWPETGESPGKISIPRLHNSVESIHWLDSSPPPSTASADESVKLHPGIESWDIELPATPTFDMVPVLVLTLNGPPVVCGERPPLMVPNRAGEIELHARNVITHGKMLRFEPQPHKNTVGYWVEQTDIATWRFKTEGTMTMDVTLRYGCGNEEAGSTIQIEIDQTVIPFQVEGTGGFQSWKTVQLGTTKPLPAGEHTVTVRPVRKAKNAVMDIQQLTLTPRALE